MLACLETISWSVDLGLASKPILHLFYYNNKSFCGDKLLFTKYIPFKWLRGTIWAMEGAQLINIL